MCFESQIWLTHCEQPHTVLVIRLMTGGDGQSNPLLRAVWCLCSTKTHARSSFFWFVLRLLQFTFGQSAPSAYCFLGSGLGLIYVQFGFGFRVVAP